ncbi:GntR family transcriptional regulator [Mesorhizobium sp.]|uniref:GntR family transcriptional regulator n=1 Tax=Mesorhizobium sp. TaxID=1871066 RepID=UPI000FEA2128|nr:GntR family transcriptional regulator [Mesorhizobium sp.]RWG07802.1 MAG: GntR family transcriptional regulator [Mesorhizobium sp.]RWH02887.1 MAG: GntR family transcriptional regulator [Mesorhizobium sp.]TIR95597.1 MAG: GntR family transcriptional regulator [Mesorhizobium sp.]TIS04107.1 MAG: GntR family transcriptional regulator [Mesorhizobium sp.]
MESGPAEIPLLRRPARLGDEVYNAIYAQLMSHKIPPGGRLSVDQLARELGVSQTPVREALSRLEAQGLVVRTHLIGYSAANQLDAENLRQLYELRLVLEPYAASRAAANMSGEQIAALEAIDGELRRISKEDMRAGYGAYAQYDTALHDHIASGSGNALIQQTLSRLHTHVHLFRLHFHHSATKEANVEHRRIIAAIRAHDPDAAESAMREHILRSQERFMGPP